MCSLLEERSSWDSVRGREDAEEEERRDDVDKDSDTVRRPPGKLNEREIAIQDKGKHQKAKSYRESVDQKD